LGFRTHVCAKRTPSVKTSTHPSVSTKQTLQILCGGTLTRPQLGHCTLPRNYAAVLPFWRLRGSLNGYVLVPPTRKSRLRFLVRPKSSKTVVMFMKKHLLAYFPAYLTDRPPSIRIPLALTRTQLGSTGTRGSGSRMNPPLPTVMCDFRGEICQTGLSG